MIRTATADDARAISSIYNHYVSRSTCTFAVDEEALEDRIEWLGAHTERYPATVCEIDGNLVGWGSLSKWHSRAAYDRTVEVSLYVHHNFHRRGIGRTILNDLIDRATHAGHHALMSLVCHEQTASIELQLAAGFDEVGRLPEVGFKFDRWLDVVYLQRLLSIA